MKKIVIICGLVSGLIAGGWCVFYISLCSKNMNFEHGMIYGYTAMLVSFSLVFVGVKKYRDDILNGQISFWSAFKVAMLIVAISSTLYVGIWLVDYFFFVSNFAEVYTVHELNKLKATGANAGQIAAKAKEMADFSRMYRNPFFNAAMTYCEILPVGIIAALFSALVLKRKPSSVTAA